ncbi:MAG TPA: glycerol-3-phosphate dehydrogenase/oxidase, partial [Geomobilimonas sp.]|nr:glycerol-3-phosphate dehydrogenase/oxidase [Geomobilimonas sp.]
HPDRRAAGAQGGVIYHDGQFDDARLAVALARTLEDLGGTPLNYVRVTGLVKEHGLVTGVTARDEERGEQFVLPARVVVNATGVFTDGMRRLDEPDCDPLIVPSQGVHLVLDRSFLPGDSAIMVPHTDDGRVLFAVPWHDRVIVGTTDTPVGSTPLEPRPLPEEIEFLLAHAARYLTRDPAPGDVLSVFAGLRPLVQSGKGGTTASLSRDHTLLVSSSGLVTITGGKWTTYRHMGEETVTAAAAVAGLAERPSVTQELRIHGWSEDTEKGMTGGEYGSDAVEVEGLVAENPAWGGRLHPRLPYRGVDVIWGVRREYARTVEDVLARRTRALFLDARASMEMAPAVAQLMASELGRDVVWEEAQVDTYRLLAAGYLPTAS